MDIKEIYLQEEFYNPRVQATIPGAWIAVLVNGEQFPVCADYQASDPEEVMVMLRKLGFE